MDKFFEVCQWRKMNLSELRGKGKNRATSLVGDLEEKCLGDPFRLLDT